MNQAQRNQANQLRELLRANEVVAFNPQNGRCSIFGMGLNRTPETLRRFGWEVVYTHAPAGIKLAASAQDIPDTMDATDAPAKRGRKAKPDRL